MKAKQQKSWQQKIHRNELILQSIGEGVCGIDLERKISFANPSSLKMLGYRNEEILGVDYNKVFYGKSVSKFDELDICPIQFALIDGEISHVKVETFFRQNGTSFLVEYVCVPLIEDEKIIGAVITFQDITERRDLEIALAQAHESAIQTANAKANFLANMSHEIRTPLNGIIGMNNLLLETNLSKEQQNFSATINKSAELLLEIVNDILDFSKIEAGKLELENVEFSLDELLEEVMQVFKIQANNKNLKLFYKLQKDYQLIGDVVRIKQIFNNIIGNAIKFTDSGEIAINVKKITENKFCFSVKDTGIGITESAKVNLFQPFSQADASTTRRFGGTGLGLAICKQLVEMMNGEIGLESEIGKGSEFWFTLELSQQSENLSRESDKKDLVLPKKLFKKSADIKILVADDNAVNQQVALGILRTLGFSAEIVSSGQGALKRAKTTTYDLILMDCQMPKMDGYETTKEIRLLKNDSSLTKIIAMTAHVGGNEREKCLQAGMDDYLSKPFTKDDLREILERNLFDEGKKHLDSNQNFGQDSLSDLLEPDALNNLLEIESRGEKNFVAELLELYFKHAESQISEITSFLSKKDQEKLEKLAHSLKGSSGSIGLKKMYQLSNDLEIYSAESDWQIIEKQVNLIITEFTNIKKIVKNKF